MAEEIACLAHGIPLEPLPPYPNPVHDTSVPHAPVRDPKLSEQEFKQALFNALRYFPEKYHETLVQDFIYELKTFGHIYMYRFRPTSYEMRARSIDHYPAKCKQAAAIMLMIQNNLDPRVAQYPHELITYGGNGSVFSNWAQYHLTMKYLSEMTDEQTLAMYSGHPMGLFPSRVEAPRVVITNGMMVPNYSTKEIYEKLYALGSTIYGQMTAGSYCYIGPQGIVHGTTLTIMGAGRKYLNTSNLAGKLLITSGLGGMSGAQPKAADICGCVSVTAEVNEKALRKRHSQGWVSQWSDDIEKVIQMAREAKEKKLALSIAYLGNIVDLWEGFVKEFERTGENLVELGSDQTSLHNPFYGGYYPVGVSFEEANRIMVEDNAKFKELVQASLRRQVDAINKLTQNGTRFWDYGNSFLLEASRANADVKDTSTKSGFKYPSYVEDIMGDIFSLGFGPFRWVCTSNDESDLDATDKIAAEVTHQLSQDAPKRSQQQYEDNYKWIIKAKENKLVVGSQARILYSDANGRATIALKFNEAIKKGIIKSPVVLSRDHHDVSGTDSPYRETSNIYDSSNLTADMSIQTIIGDSFRGATWVSIHNGGGTGWGEASNGGFGLVLDGSDEAATRAHTMLSWDVNNGVCRRAWCGHNDAYDTISRAMQSNPLLHVTLPNKANDQLIQTAVAHPHQPNL